jgi:hypothetical protein
MVRTRLIIEVEDSVWQQQLFTLRRQILDRLNAAVGRPLVEELEFRVGLPRRQPVRAESVAFEDEADGIRDPVLRSIYRTSRKKASA